jgi:hypothetical protein
MIDDVYIFDDIITKNHQELIKELVFDTYSFPWYIKLDLSGNTEKNQNEKFTSVPGFANVFYNRLGITNSELFKYSIPIAENVFKKIERPLNQIHYGRTFFQFPLATHSGISNPHVDIEDFDHIVVLYYVIDADGDTLLLDKRDDGHGRPSFENYNVINRITPKQGRCVVFDGRTYHTNILPQQSQRCIINMNLT